MACQISIRFYEELNDFLTPERRKVEFAHALRDAGSVKDLIESLGVPHTEVDLILVDGVSVDFQYRVRDGDRISVYPVFEALDITPLTHLRPAPLRVSRFVLDAHLGRLAAYLRMLGFDSLYRNDYDDPTLARISAEEHRILLTRDRRLLMHRRITHGCFVRARRPQAQLLEIVARFDLFGARRPFTRCMHCNGLIQPIDKDAVADRLPPRTRAYYHEFWQCPACGRIYWKGSHYMRMQELIDVLESECAARNASPG
ncbi:MAG TPA: Mut7-C RNAse domain-containing protein [Gammaproteobacteria bacterium]